MLNMVESFAGMLQWVNSVHSFVQLYAVALYVEEDAAKQELQRLDKKGFFQDYSVDSLCAGLQQGSFAKFLDIRLLRTVTYSQFTGTEPKSCLAGMRFLLLSSTTKKSTSIALDFSLLPLTGPAHSY